MENAAYPGLTHVLLTYVLIHLKCGVSVLSNIWAFLLLKTGY